MSSADDSRQKRLKISQAKFVSSRDCYLQLDTDKNTGFC